MYVKNKILRYKGLWFGACLIIILASLSASPGQAQEITPTSQVPVVRAVMFWMDTCGHCHYVLDEVLPPLQSRYGEQLDIFLIELKSAEDFDRLYQTAAAFGIAKEMVGVPFLVIGDRVLIGSDQIPAELPGLIEQYLAEGGVDTPNLPTAQTPTPVIVAQGSENQPPVQASNDPVEAVPYSNGFTLAILVIVGMAASLLFIGLTFVRGVPALPRIFSMRWIETAISLLCLIGLGVAGYLAYVETQAVQAVCGPVGDCIAVQSSPYARLYGVLPVGILGILGYLGILAGWFYPRLRRDRLARYAPLIVFGMTILGVLFSLYLTFLEPFVIRAVCIWCITSAVIMTVLLYLSLKPALQAMQALQEMGDTYV